ncbi:Gfo/Idh/MocA family protein [Paenibacillus sp. GXUN7292]|uniref:Gfo/Idh/MocA family protein n=1 Tax=Paenibacillus sp. GXUN7292 TaxID=3422499 RepID=UPI003D7E9DC2
MKVAIIGCGFMGFTHAAAYQAMANVELVGMCGMRERDRMRVVERGIPYFDTLEQMISEAKPEVINICLPTHLHKEMTVKAASAGIHVICEKPMAGNLADAKEMIQVCKRNKVKLFIAHVLRFFPSYQNMTAHVRQGEIGDLGVINTRRVVAHPGKEPGSWYNDDAKSGGVVMDLMIHDTDFVSSLLGEADTVYAMKRKTAEKQYALVTIKFTNGTLANLEALWGYAGPLTYSCRISGKKGVIRFNSESSSSIRMIKDVEKEKVSGADSGSAAEAVRLQSPLLRDPYQTQLEHFIACIKDGTEPVISEYDAYNALLLSLAANHSAEIGQPVKLSTFATGGEV